MRAYAIITTSSNNVDLLELALTVAAHERQSPSFVGKPPIVYLFAIQMA